jgi:hypothetical protein
MKSVSAPISLAGSQLGETRHVCALFAVIDIMRTDPMIIIGGTLQQNPFFVPPDEFLREFRQRRAGRSSSPAAA